MCHRWVRSRRKAFTLIELMVVMTTIAILALITLQVAGAAIDLARHKSTETTLWRLRHFTESRQQAFDRWLKRPGSLEGTWDLIAVKRDSRFKDLPDRVQRLIATKLLEAKFFPQDPIEFWDGNAYPVGSTLQSALVDSPLMQGFWRAGDDALPMRDAWGSTIVFYRWPTELFRQHPELLPTPDWTRDPEDPLGDLSGLWNGGDLFSDVVRVQMPEPCRVSLMVFVSPGPDRKLGMEGPLGRVTDEEAFSDNLFSLRVR